jgi:molybdopterin converting factor subunit 1
MRVRVLFFSVLQDIAGKGAHEITLPAGEKTIADLLETLFEKWPALRAWDASLLIAMDHHYVRRNDVLKDNSEIAVMPPVQGG